MDSNFVPSVVVLSVLAAMAQADEVKVARPLPNFVDVKTAAQAAPVAAPAVERSVPDSAAPLGSKPPKSGSQAGATSNAPIVDFSAVRFDEPGDGAVWVRGRSYKARFDAASATYIPFLGSNAPQNFPVRVELSSASAGETAFALDSLGVEHSGDDVVIRRGTLREVWHMGLESAEQTFEIASLPAEGDLRLHLTLETELAPRATSAGLELSCARGGVSIGRATAIDAGGRRLVLETSYASGALDIVVPAAFLATATLPLTIDPVYTTNALDVTTSATALPDTCGAGSNGNFAAVYQFTYSATDSDVWTQDVYFGIPQGNGVWVDYTTSTWVAPRIAYNALYATYLTVASVRPTSNAPGEIWVRARAEGTTTQFPQNQVQSSILGSCFYPDVGGDPALAAPTYFLISWTRAMSSTDWDIHARLIDYDGTPVGSTIFIENSSAYDWFPRVSKTDGRPPYSTQEWNITWIRNNATSDVYGAQVHWDGVVTTPAFPIETSSFQDLFPSASSLLDGGLLPRPWMVTYVRTNTGLGTDDDIMADVLVGSSIQTTLNVSVNEYGAIFEKQGNPDVDSDGQRFAVAYSETYNGSTSDHDLYLATLRWSNNQIFVDEAHVLLDYSSLNSTAVEISSNITTTNQGTPTYGLAWELYDSTVEDVYVGSYYEPSPQTVYCTDGVEGTCPCGSQNSCLNSTGHGGQLFPQGNAYFSNDTLSLYAYYLPASTTALLFQGTTVLSTAVPFGDGLRCVGGTVTRLGVQPTVNGTVTFPGPGTPPLSVSGGIPSDGAMRTYQVWYRNAVAFCTASTFNLTTAYRVVWLR